MNRIIERDDKHNFSAFLSTVTCNRESSTPCTESSIILTTISLPVGSRNHAPLPKNAILTSRYSNRSARGCRHH